MTFFRGQARRYEAKVLRGNLQEDLKTPRHSYHQWQIPDASRLFEHFFSWVFFGGQTNDIPGEPKENRLAFLLKGMNYCILW